MKVNSEIETEKEKKQRLDVIDVIQLVFIRLMPADRSLCAIVCVWVCVCMCVFGGGGVCMCDSQLIMWFM